MPYYHYPDREFTRHGPPPSDREGSNRDAWTAPARAKDFGAGRRRRALWPTQGREVAQRLSRIRFDRLTVRDEDSRQRLHVGPSQQLVRNAFESFTSASFHDSRYLRCLAGKACEAQQPAAEARGAADVADQVVQHET